MKHSESASTYSLHYSDPELMLNALKVHSRLADERLTCVTKIQVNAEQKEIRSDISGCLSLRNLVATNAFTGRDFVALARGYFDALKQLHDNGVLLGSATPDTVYVNPISLSFRFVDLSDAVIFEPARLPNTLPTGNAGANDQGNAHTNAEYAFFTDWFPQFRELLADIRPTETEINYQADKRKNGSRDPHSFAVEDFTRGRFIRSLYSESFKDYINALHIANEYRTSLIFLTTHNEWERDIFIEEGLTQVDTVGVQLSLHGLTDAEQMLLLAESLMVSIDRIVFLKDIANKIRASLFGANALRSHALGLENMFIFIQSLHSLLVQICERTSLCIVIKHFESAQEGISAIIRNLIDYPVARLSVVCNDQQGNSYAIFAGSDKESSAITTRTNIRLPSITPEILRRAIERIPAFSSEPSFEPALQRMEAGSSPRSAYLALRNHLDLLSFNVLSSSRGTDDERESPASASLSAQTRQIIYVLWRLRNSVPRDLLTNYCQFQNISEQAIDELISAGLASEQNFKIDLYRDDPQLRDTIRKITEEQQKAITRNILDVLTSLRRYQPKTLELLFTLYHELSEYPERTFRLGVIAAGVNAESGRYDTVLRICNSLDTSSLDENDLDTGYLYYLYEIELTALLQLRRYSDIHQRINELRTNTDESFQFILDFHEIELYKREEDNNRAITIGLSRLWESGLKIPRLVVNSELASIMYIMYLYCRCRLFLGHKSLSSLASGFPSLDQVNSNIADMLERVGISAYYNKPLLMLVMSMRGILEAKKRGPSFPLSRFLMMFAVTEIIVFRRQKSGRNVIASAASMSQRSPQYRAYTINLYQNLLINCWQEGFSLENCCTGLLSDYRACLESKDYEMSSFASTGYYAYSIMQGIPLNQLRGQITTSLVYVKQFSHESQYHMHLLIHAFMEVMLSPGEISKIQSEHYNEDTYRDYYLNANNMLVTFSYYWIKLLTSTLSGEWNNATHYFRQGLRSAKGAFGLPHIVAFRSLGVVAYCNQYRSSRVARSFNLIKALKEISILKVHATRNSAFLPYYQLAKAEYLSVAGNSRRATANYVNATDAFQKSRMYHFAAIACERLHHHGRRTGTSGNDCSLLEKAAILYKKSGYLNKHQSLHEENQSLSIGTTNLSNERLLRLVSDVVPAENIEHSLGLVIDYIHSMGIDEVAAYLMEDTRFTAVKHRSNSYSRLYPRAVEAGTPLYSILSQCNASMKKETGRHNFGLFYPIMAYRKPLFIAVRMEPGEASTEEAIEAILDMMSASFRNVAKFEILRQEVGMNERLNKYVANLSHELKTPLNTAYHSLLRMGGDYYHGAGNNNNPSGLLHFPKALSAVERCIDLTRDSIDLEMIRQGRITLDEKPFNLETLISRCVDELLNYAEAKGLSLRFPGRLDWPTHYIGDENRIYQVIHNLLNNAIKYTHQGDITLSVEIVNRDSPFDHLSITVTNTGEKIPEDLQSSLFDPFVRGNASATRKSNGSGLGLTISRELASLLGGSLELLTSNDSYTRFRFFLSLLVAPGDSSFYREAEAVTTTGLQGRIITVIDDDDHERELIQELLESWGAKVITYHSAASALKSLKDGGTDIILCDIEMPDMDGFSFTRQFRLISDTPVIGISAHSFNKVDAKALDSGMDDYISKPYRIAQLNDAIAKQLAEAPKDVGLRQ